MNILYVLFTISFMFNFYAVLSISKNEVKLNKEINAHAYDIVSKQVLEEKLKACIFLLRQEENKNAND